MTDSRDRISESLSSALLVSLLDAKIHLYTLVNNSDISSVLGDGQKNREDRCQETAVITKEPLSQGNNCSNFLSRNGLIHSPPTVCVSLMCFHSTRHKIMPVIILIQLGRIHSVGCFQVLCVAHGSGTAFVNPDTPKAFPAQMSPPVTAYIVF